MHFRDKIDYSDKRLAKKIQDENFIIYKKLVEIYTGYDKLKRSKKTQQMHNENYKLMMQKAKESRRTREKEQIQVDNLRLCKRLLEIDYS